MKILIPNIPNKFRRQDLLAVAQSAVKSNRLLPFRKSGTVAKCNLIRILDIETGAVEYHGLIDIYPPKAAIKAIRVLDGKEHQGHRLAAREWIDRTLMIGGKKNLPVGQSHCKRRKNLEISVV